MFPPIEDLRKHLISIQQVSCEKPTGFYHNCLVATDMDGTLTKDGKFTSTLLKS